MTPRCVAVVPARWGSRRFPGKPLALLAGKPMIVHVLERARAAAVFDAVWVATDDARIVAAVQAAGGEARWTRAEHATGTERVAEASADLAADAIVLNVQGDEPLVPPALLAELVACLRQAPDLEMATAAHAAADAAGFASPHVVKVVVDGRGDALYFSRAPIPASRGGVPRYWRHVGVYAFRAAALQRFVRLPPGRLEAIEGLEQLRALENGMRIRVHVSEHESIGVDTPEDLKAVARRLTDA
jgi:3-deoxy-manno-octulosonate cytidylyltransferase (CMP-KDO synthetase)